MPSLKALAIQAESIHAEIQEATTDFVAERSASPELAQLEHVDSWPSEVQGHRSDTPTTEPDAGFASAQSTVGLTKMALFQPQSTATREAAALWWAWKHLHAQNKHFHTHTILGRCRLLIDKTICKTHGDTLVLQSTPEAKEVEINEINEIAKTTETNKTAKATEAAETMGAAAEENRLADSNGNVMPWSVWSSRQRKLIVLTASFASLLSPLSSQIYFPALGAIARDLQVSDSLVNLSITTYVILQAIAPTFTAQLSDEVGRRPLYMTCFVLYTGANIGLGVQHSYTALLVLRCVQSAGSSGMATLASAVATDLTTPAERGRYIAYAAAVPMLGSTLGPIIGGLLAQFAGWHSVFWFLVALTGVVVLVMVPLFPETCRKIVDDGSIPPQRWNRCYANVLLENRLTATSQEGLSQLLAARTERDARARARPRVRLPNPLATLRLLLQRECGVALLYSALLCCSFYATLSLIPSQFGAVYHFNELQIALCYIPFGLGSLVAAFHRGRMLDANLQRHARRLGIVLEKNRNTDLADFPIERARLEVALPTIVLGSASMVGFGWMLHAQVSLAGPLIFLFVMAFCISSSLNCVVCLMLDVYPRQAGAVTAANNLVRCLFGAAATAVVVPMINGIGVGWAITIFAVINIIALPLLWYVMKRGPVWRAATRQKNLDKKAAQGVPQAV
ncbi:major facilitator superfamily transporter [Grosmannia clavigera kw1407]|uniref:Major facilitator superfamily transporter n=1 Tax=Grosmannia clavigera (strain kw1407 / UAMH 11150) TaxID=655863 RepID=F0XCT5_GROCL|nr:major facilitator superfamily transporter [Grosmannia clavigera kw1407]EFX03857.1 major facilitator superfamily transporter [Grosmannia clavigera kw1407]